MESVTRGGTRWRRFAVVMVPCVAASVAIGVALSQGALAASFSVSGQRFTLSAAEVDGTGYVQYAAVDSSGSAQHPVAVIGLEDARITDLCQSVVVPVGVFGDLSVKLTAGRPGTPQVVANRLYLDAEEFRADATFRKVDIGVSVDGTTKGPGPAPGDRYEPGSFAQQAESVLFTDVRQRARAATAGTLKLSGMVMRVQRGAHECT
ncbi:DUF6230 family protein [Streptomyces sp. LE64]|jgi:hypothetical protein|uniref:DUF6230 family protein n=1 Tax=unclassified Streptomyces TaxID=2593676 RepID=UPI003332235C